MFGANTTFPATFSQLSTGQLIDAYASAPGRLRTATQGLSEHQLRDQPIPNKWSIIEIAMHLTDSEVMGAGRFLIGFAQPGTRFMGYDQHIWTATWGHRAASVDALAASLDLFEAVRRSLVPAMRRFTPAEWSERGGIHPEHGAMTLRNLLELYTEHAERHLMQIRERRRLLGADPSVVTVAIETRLY